jgi:Zn-dependent protease with chaperone function
MWGLLFMGLMWAQYNIKILAPGVLGMTTPFPADVFAVGREFPWASTSNDTTPWISLNRIYFRDPFSASSSIAFRTKDKSKGQLSLTRSDSGKWVITGTLGEHGKTQVYAKTVAASDTFTSQPWTRDADARVGQRSGSQLLDKLFMFARQRHIGISQVYMIDGSHKDVRANAFVAGAGNSSVIGLFDTLFLGERSSAHSHRSSEVNAVESLALGESPLQQISELVQAVDVGDAEDDREAPRHSAPTQAMEDDEIVAILAHELGHAALNHLEQGMVMHSITSFITFAALGWMAHSPFVAASLSLAAPILHIGAGVYDYLVGPPLEGITALFSTHLVRRNEYQADAFAASISEKYGTALQASLAKLCVNSNQDPDIPLFYDLLHHDHPSFALRWAHIEAVKKNPSQYYSDTTSD